jgi:hypothetical protein
MGGKGTVPKQREEFSAEEGRERKPVTVNCE